MILLRMHGRLGNQMFQYAYGRYLSAQYHQRLILDAVRPIRGKPSSPFELDCFDIKERIIHWRLSTHFFWDIFAGRFPPWIKYLDHEPIDLEAKIKRSRLSLVWGFFMWLDHINRIEQVLRQQFVYRLPLTPAADRILADIRTTNAVAIHVRGGDYLHQPDKFAILTESYYAGAVESLRNKIRNPRFFVFSDNPEWTRATFTTDEFSIVDSERAHSGQDMYLMSQCKHQIIANSTYSWWASWLNNNPDKKVIAPGRWFVDEEKNRTVLSNLVHPLPCCVTM